MDIDALVEEAQGLAGVAVMLWAFYASLVLLFGAEYVRVLREERENNTQQIVSA